MPFTPFHFGPAGLIKAIIPSCFSLSVFCFSQVVIDFEVLIRMAREEKDLHGFFHTFPGATMAAVLSATVGWRICSELKKGWCRTPGLPLKEFFKSGERISIPAAIVASFTGAYSHLLFDAIMHPDVLPKATIGLRPLLGVMGPGALHLVCFLLGVLAILVWGWRNRKAGGDSKI